MSNSSLKKLSSDLKYVYSDNNSINVIFQNNDLLMGVVGEFNSNLKELEKLTNTNIYFRGNSILIKSDSGKNEIVKNAIQFLAEQFINNESIEKKDIISSINKFMIEEKNNSKEKIEYIIKTPKRSVIPRSERQKKYVRALKESDIIISAGPAGTGKTYLAVAVALTMLLEKKIERIILSRPAVEAGEKLGFLPGDLKEKVDPFLRPIYDALYEMLPYDQVEKKISNNVIEIAPIAFMRGRTLEDCFIILDEAQNTTRTQMKMFLTRLGRNSQMVIVGDSTQIDLVSKDDSGFIDASEKLTKINDIGFITLQEKDVVRHDVVRKIINAYEVK